MEIYNLVRGHFALLFNKPLSTPIQAKEFSIQSIDKWQMVLTISTGKTANVYFSDIFQVYMFVVFAERTITISEIFDFAEKKCIRKGTASYVLPLICTFTDIEVINGEQLSIRYKPSIETL